MIRWYNALSSRACVRHHLYVLVFPIFLLIYLAPETESFPIPVYIIYVVITLTREVITLSLAFVVTVARRIYSTGSDRYRVLQQTCVYIRSSVPWTHASMLNRIGNEKCFYFHYLLFTLKSNENRINSNKLTNL